MERLLNFNWKL